MKLIKDLYLRNLNDNLDKFLADNAVAIHNKPIPKYYIGNIKYSYHVSKIYVEDNNLYDFYCDIGLHTVFIQYSPLLNLS
jgi:predicted RNA-binding protein associated with RNAse of E/G family